MPGEQVGSAYVTLGLDSSKFDSGMGQAEGKLRGFAGSMANILKVGAVAGGAAIAGAATLGIKSFVDYESGLYDIAKVTGMTGDELKGLGEGLRAMSLESGQAVTGLEAIAAIAGQMGMQGSADILKFTETVNQASVAFGIAPEAAAAAMGKIGNIWDIPTQELYKMGSAVNYLGNTTNASEAQLLDYMMAIGNQPRVLGMTSQETLLFGSTLVSMGMDASDAGTRLNAAFGQQGLIGHLPAAAKQLGVTEAALKGMIDADPTDTVLRLIDSMSGITSETERLQVAQEIFGAIGGKAIVPLIGRTDQFRASLGNVNTEYEKGTAMAEEYKTRWGALGVQLSRVRQGINDVAITIGEGLAPYVRGFADLLNNEVLPGVKEFTSALMSGDWDKVGDSLQRGIKYGWDKIKDIGKDLLSRLKSVNWSSVGDTVWKAVQGGLDKLRGIGGQVLTWLQGVDYGAVGTTIFNAISGGLKLAADYIKNYTFPGTIIQGLMGDWTQFDRLKTAFISVINPIKDAAVGLGTAIWDSLGKIDWKSMGETAARAIKGAIDTLSKIGDQIANWIRSGLKSNFSGDANSAAERIKSGFATLTSYWNEFKAGLTTIKWDVEGRNLAEKIKGGIAEIKDWADGILDNLKTGFSDWINSNGPGKLGEDLAKAIANGAAKIGQWIADKLKGGDSKKAITDAFNYLGGLVDWAILAGKAAWSFVSGFAKTLISYGKGTIGAAILDIFANAFRGLNDKIPDWLKPLLGGLGDVADRIDDLAQSWRDAMPPLDTSVDVEVEYSGTDPSTLDGQTFKSTLLVDAKYTDSSGSPISGITGSTLYRPGTNERLYKYKGQELTAAELGRQLADEGWTREDVTASFGPLNEWMESTLGKKGGSKWAYREADFDKILDAFDSAGGAADKLDGVLKTGEQLFKELIGDFDKTWKESTKTLADAIKENTTSMTTSQRVAANALKLGGEIGGKLLGEGGNAVRIGLDASGREIAIIGRVAQENFVKAGGTFTDGIQTSTTRASGAIQVGAQRAASEATGAATTAGNTAKTAAATAGITTTTNAQKAANSINSGADQARAKIAAAGDAGTKLVIGAQYAANAIVSAGSAFASAVRAAAGAFSNASYYRPNPWGGYKYATGTITAGPELAMIGEDGSQWPEFVIPTKTKRWDLLFAALQAYGVRGFAEGGSTGGVSGGDASVGFSGSIIISIGKLNQAVVQALTDIVNRFRVSWAVIKADATKHWLALTSNTFNELSQYRSTVALAMSETRTAVISSMVDLIDRGKAIWTEGRESISQQAAYLADNIRLASDNTRIAVEDLWTSTKDEINNSITEVETVWSNGWTKMDTDLGTALTSIRTKIQEISALIKSISGASVNIGVSGYIGGGGGGGSGGGGGGGGSAADQFINQYFGDTTCQIDELSGMSPGLIQSLIQSGAWSPNNSALSQKIAQAYGYGTSAAQVLGGAGMAAAKGIAGGIGAALAGGSIGDSTYVTRQGQLVGGTVGTGYASQSSSWGSMASQAARGSSGVYKIGGYDAGGISARPQIAVVSGQGEPELHLTKSNVREFLGDGGDRPMIIQVFLGDREVTDLVMKKAVSKMRTKGLQMG